IARMLTNNRVLLSKIKVIISSATLHPSVPKLFQNIKHVKFSEFTDTNMPALHSVERFSRPKENIINIVKELYKVNQCCRLLAEVSQKTIVGYPLVQSQSSSTQKKYLQKGSVFFSTTVAETSLTFPSLKYVVDTGMINVPIFDIGDRRMILKEVPAAESTIKQRYGRLGRTQPGEYYALYDPEHKKKQFPIPQICQSDLISIEFSLRKSPLKNGLDYLKQFLPEQPTSAAIYYTTQELVRM
ncbi:unnamed protein product, partial [Rotaria sp. Silwood1]